MYNFKNADFHILFNFQPIHKVIFSVVDKDQDGILTKDEQRDHINAVRDTMGINYESRPPGRPPGSQPPRVPHGQGPPGRPGSRPPPRHPGKPGPTTPMSPPLGRDHPIPPGRDRPMPQGRPDPMHNYKPPGP